MKMERAFSTVGRSAHHHAGFHSLYRLTPWLPKTFWRSLTFIGDTGLGLVLVSFFVRRNLAIPWVIFIVVLYGTRLSHGLKALIDIRRPPSVLAAEQFNLVDQGFHHCSFPSGHSLTFSC